MVRYLDYKRLTEPFPVKKFLNPKRRLRMTDSRDPAEIARMEQIELSRVRRRYRIVKTYSRPYWQLYNSQIKTDKHNFMIKVKDHDNICLAGMRIGSSTYKKIDSKAANFIKTLVDERLRLKEEVKNTRDGLKERKRQVCYANKAIILRNRKPNGGPHRYMTSEYVESTIPRYENKLWVVTTLKDKAIAAAGESRKIVASMLSERVITREQLEKCLYHLQRGKRYMIDLIEQALIAFSQREEALQTLFAVKERRTAEMDKARTLMGDLSRLYYRFENRAKLFTVKNQRRVIQEEVNDKSGANDECEDTDDENEMKGYLRYTQPHIMEVVVFFQGSDNFDMISKYIQECLSDNQNFLKLLIHYAHESEQNFYLAKLVSYTVADSLEMNKNHRIQRELDLVTLEIEAKKLEYEFLFCKKKLDYILAYHKFIYDAVQKMVESTPLKKLFVNPADWRTVDLVGECLYRIQEMISDGLIKYKYNHPELFPKVFITDKKGKRKYLLPKDKRERLRHIRIVNQERRLLKKLKKPLTPCAFCIEEDRFADFRQSEDKVRSRLEIFMKLQSEWDAPFMIERLHSLTGCTSPKHKEIFTKDILES
ncbi:uncharacterized protein LOC106668676 [Cimex lectularius]|uniref:ODAD1 central coiled coil region domain-containing protein n=1 Tax=Cimex lectularius TaxID=79782 RepID=A0A8I6RVE4_CIMLE|nr:uncharacterized protein LOC106668676 [Cimex lectularius]